MAKKLEGFTLIELVIVIGIISILVAALISVLNPAMYQKKARDAVRKNHILEIAKAASAYYSENGSWPSKDALCPEDGMGFVKTWPDSDPSNSPNTYTVPVSGTDRFCTQVGQEVYTDKYIIWDSNSGKIEENVAGCSS